MAIYNKFLQKGYDGSDIDLTTATLRIAFCGDGYTPNTGDAGHEFLSDVTDIISTSADLTGVSWTARVLDSDDVVLPDAGGDIVEQAVLYIWTGASGTSPLIRVDDSATGFPHTLDGTDDNYNINASGHFKLGS